MIKKIIPITAAGIIAVVFITSLFFSTESNEFKIAKMDLSYDSNSKIQSVLEINGIAMSDSLKIQGDSIAKYCDFFSDDDLQKSISYCTSTELIDSKGKFIGNVHMVGDEESPFVVLGIMQTDPFMSEIDSVKLITNTLVEVLVCSCWDDFKPGGFESAYDWVEASKSHHLEAKKITSKSEINGLAEKQLLIEISANQEGYLWKFIVTK